MDAAERASKLESMKAAMKKAEDDHNELLVEELDASGDDVGAATPGSPYKE